MQESERPDALPGYTSPEIKARLLTAGASGTIYALVMPESEAGIVDVVDGHDASDAGAGADARVENWLSKFREPWTQKQDAMHVEYFDRWIEWSAPVMRFDPDAYPYRYPTAGASEGIFKIMSEYAATMRSEGREPTIHVFEGEYEGFPSFGKSLSMRIVRHRRDEWRKAVDAIDEAGQFWISQPSSIDGGLWDQFEAFVESMASARPDVQIIPDLSYVGSVARTYEIAIDHPNIPAFVISQSKPFGGYYHRCGGVFARDDRPSLLANKWFKNLTSIAWGVRMMKQHDVFDLPRRYRDVQEKATIAVAERLGVGGLRPCDISMLAIAPVPSDVTDTIRTLIRGEGADRCIRICVTPTMTVMIDPEMAPDMAWNLLGNEK